MRLAFIAPLPLDTARPPLRQRATSLVLALLATLLMIVGIWTLNDRAPERPRFKGSPVLLDFQPDADKADTTKKQAAKPQPRQAEARPKPTPPPPTIPPPPPPTLPVVHPYYIPLTKEENDTADISKIRHPELAGAGPRSAGSDQASAGSPGDSRPIGTARDGTPLYRAQWFREPTHAELAFYLPKNKDIHGAGIVECRTIADHHVDDCVEVASTPPGSHLAGAVRQAAWQFLVRPPRRGGQELIGAWVYIEIDYDVTTVRESDKPLGAATSEE